jgi:hypothetical protein
MLDRMLGTFGPGKIFTLSCEEGRYFSLGHGVYNHGAYKVDRAYQKEEIFRYQRKVLGVRTKSRLTDQDAEEARAKNLPGPRIDGLKDVHSRTFPASLQVVERSAGYLRFRVEVLAHNGSRAGVCTLPARRNHKYEAWVAKMRDGWVQYSYNFAPAAL